MKRRSLLTLVTAVTLDRFTQRAQATEATQNAAGKPAKVIVIGAGLAGLAAAQRLRAHGIEVQVLEARSRLGGRLCTSEKWPDSPIDLGASWIHGLTDNPLTDLAEQANAKLLETSYDNYVLYDTDGEELSGKREKQLELTRAQFRKALRAAQAADDDVSIREFVNSLARTINADEETKRLLDFIVSSEIEQEYAGSDRRLSTHWYDSAKSFDGEDALFESGYQGIVDHLSKGLTVQSDTIVKRIDWSKDVIQVIANRGTYTADKVLITLPLGVLKADTVEFSPALPKEKTEAITKLEMGVLNKCYLLFEENFWPDVDWMEYIPDKHGRWSEWVSLMRVAGQPILLGFNAGDRACEIEAWSNQQIVASAMQTLRTIFGAEIPDPSDYQITRWATDPFAFGSYSFNPVGSHPKLRQQLAMPIRNKLYFAGEAAEQDYFGTAHGAYLSGLRAANEIAG